MSGSDSLVVALRSTTAIGAVGLALSASCGDGPGDEGAFAVGNLARGMCDKLIACGCFDTSYAAECQAELAYFLGPPYQYTPDPDPCYYDYYCAHGYDGGYEGPPKLALDPQCAADMEARVRGLDCRDIPFSTDCEDYCPLYHGSHWQGQRCTLSGNPFWTDCAKGLACIAGECRDPCDVVEAVEGQSCEVLECAAGLSCEYIETDPLSEPQEICLALPLAGQPCLGDDCAEGAWCDDSDPELPMCQPLREIGQECSGHAQCVTFNCPRGFCEAPAQIGDPCSQNLPCAPGLGCEDEVCVEEWALCGLIYLGYGYY